MFRKISIWPLLLACFLVVGHAVFPHTHQRSVQADSPVAQLELPLNDGLMNILSQLFSQDLGDNHLEDYNHGSENVTGLVFIAQAFLHTLLYFDTSRDEDRSGFSTLQSTPLLSLDVIIDAPLRAPPRA